MKRLLFSVILISSLVYVITSCKDISEPDLRFVFIGDIHYKTPDYRTAEYLVPGLAKELEAEKNKPEFIILTGDFFHGARGTDTETESEFAFQNFSENVKIPFFIAKGNHDSREDYERNAIPLFSKELHINITRSWYSFTRSNCHFIMLDCNEENLTDQLLWLEKDIVAAKSDPKIEHIFAAGHFPLWIVARAGFTRTEYASAVSALLAKYKVDAYFCGHTHNKTLTARMINGYPLTQIMDAGVVEENRLFNLAPFLYHVRSAPENIFRPGILPLEEGHQIFIPPSELKYYWGYQEGSTTTYYVISINGKSVRADWHVLGQGVVRSVKWDKPGMVEDIKTPVKVEGIPLKENDFHQVDKAWLYAAPWTDEDSLVAPFMINGVPAGRLEVSRARMASSPFWNKTEVQLDSTMLADLKMENEILIDNTAKRRFGLAHLFLLVRFKDGRFAKTTVSPKVLTSFIPKAGQYPNFPDAELINSVDLGEPLTKVNLRFERFYKGQ